MGCAASSPRVTEDSKQNELPKVKRQFNLAGTSAKEGSGQNSKAAGVDSVGPSLREDPEEGTGSDNLKIKAQGKSTCSVLEYLVSNLILLQHHVALDFAIKILGSLDQGRLWLL